MKEKLKFEDQKNYLEATHLQHKMILLEKDRVNVDTLKENNKEFIKTHKLLFKYNKDLEAKNIICLWKKLTKLY